MGSRAAVVTLALLAACAGGDEAAGSGGGDSADTTVARTSATVATTTTTSTVAPTSPTVATSTTTVAATNTTVATSTTTGEPDPDEEWEVSNRPDEPPIPVGDHLAVVVDTSMAFDDYVASADDAVRRENLPPESCRPETEVPNDEQVAELEVRLGRYLLAGGVDVFSVLLESDVLAELTGSPGPYLIPDREIHPDVPTRIAPCLVVVPFGTAYQPSQPPEDAERDGVFGQLALFSYAMRVQPISSVEATEGTWVISEIPPAVRGVDEQLQWAIGDPGGVDGIDVVWRNGYGEALLTDGDEGIRRAWPMPGFRPDWIVLTDDTVFVGHEGDGCGLGAALARIDRSTLDADIVAVFDVGDDLRSWVLPGWHVVGSDRADGYRAISVEAETSGERVVELPPGPRVAPGQFVDLAAADRFIDAAIADPGRQVGEARC